MKPKSTSGKLAVTLLLIIISCTSVIAGDDDGELSDWTLEEILDKLADTAFDDQWNLTELWGRVPKHDRVAIRIPPNWNIDRKAYDVVECGKTYAMAMEGYLKFQLNSEEKSCSIGFLGSQKHQCTVGFICDRMVTLNPPNHIQLGCVDQDDFLTVSDGTTGLTKKCGPFSFSGMPWKAENGGFDLYLNYRGKSDSPCVAFCLEDVGSAHEAIGSPIRLDKNNFFDGLKTTDACTCGIRNDDDIAGRIIGGHNALKFEFPWLAGLVLKHPSVYRVPICGATLISDRHVLTAGHCLKAYGHNPDKYQIILHAHIMDKIPSYGKWEDWEANWLPGWDLPIETDETEGTVRADIEEIIVHPIFDVPEPFAYDVALLKLKTPVELESLKVAPICLPRTKDRYNYEPGSTMWVAGWGVIHPSPGIQVANTRLLQKLEVPYVHPANCWFFLRNHYSLMCAGLLRGGKDSCRGDSGGPLIAPTDEGKNQYTLSGIVSSGKGCAISDSPGLYTDIREVIQWVYKHVAKDEEALWCRR